MFQQRKAMVEHENYRITSMKNDFRNQRIEKVELQSLINNLQDLTKIISRL